MEGQKGGWGAFIIRGSWGGAPPFRVETVRKDAKPKKREKRQVGSTVDPKERWGGDALVRKKAP